MANQNSQYKAEYNIEQLAPQTGIITEDAMQEILARRQHAAVAIDMAAAVEAPEVGMGVAEATTGAATGIITSAAASAIIGNNPAYNLITKDAMMKKLGEAIKTNGRQVTHDVLNEFRRINPEPSAAAAAKDWVLRAQKYLAESPSYNAFAEAERIRLIEEEFAKASEHFKSMGKKLTVNEFIQMLEGKASPAKPSFWEKPFLAFRSLSTSGQVGVVMLGIASALGAAFLVNRWRNQNATQTAPQQKFITPLPGAPSCATLEEQLREWPELQERYNILKQEMAATPATATLAEPEELKIKLELEDKKEEKEKPPEAQKEAQAKEPNSHAHQLKLKREKSCGCGSEAPAIR